jgi:hypothetical protein
MNLYLTPTEAEKLLLSVQFSARALGPGKKDYEVYQEISVRLQQLIQRQNQPVEEKTAGPTEEQRGSGK